MNAACCRRRNEVIKSVTVKGARVQTTILLTLKSCVVSLRESAVEQLVSTFSNGVTDKESFVCIFKSMNWRALPFQRLWSGQYPDMALAFDNFEICCVILQPYDWICRRIREESTIAADI